LACKPVSSGGLWRAQENSGELRRVQEHLEKALAREGREAG